MQSDHIFMRCRKMLAALLLVVSGAATVTGCAKEAPPPGLINETAADGSDAPVDKGEASPGSRSSTDPEIRALEKMPLQLTSPLSPSYVPVIVRGGGTPEALPATASQTQCTKALAKKGKDASARSYCIEAHKDGRRVVHKVT